MAASIESLDVRYPRDAVLYLLCGETRRWHSVAPRTGISRDLHAGTDEFMDYTPDTAHRRESPCPVSIQSPAQYDESMWVPLTFPPQ